MKTRTGGYSIGSRAFYPHWKPEIEEVIEWALANELECLDVQPSVQKAKKVVEAGLRIGTIDLPDWSSDRSMITADSSLRSRAFG